VHGVRFLPCVARNDRPFFSDKEAVMIKKVKGGYQVVSSSGRNLGGPYKTLSSAKRRLRQVEFFKHRKG
jgi:hypothetical protein